MSSVANETSPSKSESESPPAKRSLIIESSSIEPITRHQLYFKSEIKEISFYHQWTIENFSYYRLREDSSNHYPQLCSPMFSPPSNDKLQFCLYFYPIGDREKYKENISLFLYLVNCDRKEINLKFDCWIIESDGNHIYLFGLKSKFLHGKGGGACCAFNKILDLSTKLKYDDGLTILCKISYEEKVDEDSDDLNKFALTQLANDCFRLYKTNEFSDAVLVFRDGEQKKEFPVHKAILGARSEVFAAMFEHNMQEKNNRRVEITDADAEVGEVLLKYLYCRVPYYEQFAEKLLPIADKYQLHSLKSTCEDALLFRINPESVGNILLLADMHNSPILKLKCIDYIHCHSNCVVESESIQGMGDLMQTRPELYYELFKQIPQDPCHTWSPPTLTSDPFELSWSYTCSRVLKCSKVLTIGQFNANHLSVDRRHIDKNNPHDFIETSTFSSPNATVKSSVKFSAKLYSKGENDDCKEHLSLHLHLKCDEKVKVAVKVKASIMVKENNAKGYTLEIDKKLSNDESIGWPKFITREQLEQNKVLLLNGKNDKLVLLFEVFYIENIDNPVTKSGVNTFADEHKFSIARDLSQFYSNQKLTDIVFSLGNKKLYAHKCIVSARSSVFAQMFKSKSQAQIKDVDDVEAFEQMLALVYGQTDVLAQWAHKILPLLDKFELDSLKRACQIALCDQLSDTNVAQFLLLADKHKSAMLKDKAFEYIRRKHSVLTQNDSLKVIQHENPKLFHELLCYKLENWNNLTEK